MRSDKRAESLALECYETGRSSDVQDGFTLDVDMAM
jgi:hypothetical protein